MAAGMTGGLAYLLDEDNTLIPKVCANDPFSLSTLPPFSSHAHEWTFVFTNLADPEPLGA